MSKAALKIETHKHGPQTVFYRGNRAAVLTRLGQRKWGAALGWRGDVEMTYLEAPQKTRRFAMSYINAWLSDAR